MARIALRLQRSGLIGMSAFGIFYGVFQASAYISAAGSTVAGRAAFGRQMELFGRQFTTLLPVPQHVETLSGYLQWRVYGALPLLFGFWAVMSATGATRGDEDKQLVEMWLGSAVSRVGYVVTRFLLFAAAAVISIALTSAAIDGGAARAGSPLDLGAAVGELLALLALTLVVYALSMAAAQLAASRTAAAGMAGGLVLALFFINSFSRTDVNLQPLARVVSPFYYFDRSNGLVPGGSLDITGTVALLTLSLLLTALTVWLMTVRDIGSPLVARPRRQGPVTHLPASNPLLRVPVIEALYEHRTGLALWVVGASGLAAYYASIARTIVDVITGPGSSGFRGYLTVAGHGNPYVALVGFFWFGTFQLLLAIYVITRVSRWSSDDNEGRLEMELSAPVSRWRVVAERATALLVSILMMIGISSVAFYLAAAATNIKLHVGDLVVASLALLPFALSFGAAGALLASRVPRATVGMLTALAFASYLLTQTGPLLKLPDWTLKLSVFSLYGTPLTSGVYWTGLWIMLAISGGGFGAAAVLMQRREVGR